MQKKQRITLDTNVLLEYWKDQDKVSVVKRLLDLAKEGLVDIAVTARIREDIPDLPLSAEIDKLPLLNVQETGSITRLGHWVLGRDMLASARFSKLSEEFNEQLRRVGMNPPDWRDWDHLHAHHLLKRDVFLTWDRRILALSSELHNRMGIIIMKPEQYLESQCQKS